MFGRVMPSEGSDSDFRRVLYPIVIVFVVVDNPMRQLRGETKGSSDGVRFGVARPDERIVGRRLACCVASAKQSSGKEWVGFVISGSVDVGHLGYAECRR